MFPMVSPVVPLDAVAPVLPVPVELDELVEVLEFGAPVELLVLEPFMQSAPVPVPMSRFRRAPDPLSDRLPEVPLVLPALS